MKKKLLMVLLILTCAFSWCSVAYGIAPPPSIEGNIYLPDGKVAPPGGIRLNVIAEIPGDAQTFKTIIEEGQNSASYSFRILSMVGGLEIRCELLTPIEGYCDVSYYTGSSQKPLKSDAVKLTQMYSKNNVNITLVESKKIYGDINSDGDINAIDLAKLKTYLLGKIGNDAIDLKNSDLDLNEEINAIDFALLRKYLLGMIDKLPVAKQLDSWFIFS